MIGIALLSMAVGLSGAIIPGTLFAFTINQALLVGWSAGFWLIAGHMLAEMALVGALYAGLGGLLRRPAALKWIGLLGGLVLLYFAWDMAHLALAGPVRGMESGHGMRHAPLALVGQGLLLTLINPSWYVWWATAGMALIAAQLTNHGPAAWMAFFTGHIVADYSWYLLVSTLVALGGVFLSAPLHRGLILACAAGIAVLGVLFVARAARTWRAT